jgi:cytochrome c-type biogenesis protein CcmH
MQVLRVRPAWFRWPVVLMGLFFCLLWLGSSPVRATSAPEAVPLTPDQDVRAREIASELRCVVCQNLSVEDSPSDLAKEMRQLVREFVRQGKSRDEILSYFVSRYGEFVLLAPPKRGFNLLVWGLPFVAILAAACGVYLVARRWAQRGRAHAVPAADPAYAARVRREISEREGGADLR